VRRSRAVANAKGYSYKVFPQSGLSGQGADGRQHGFLSARRPRPRAVLRHRSITGIFGRYGVRIFDLRARVDQK
jgi:hypothetical protein